MSSADDVFAGLAGAWRLSRTIEPGLGTATGTARFRPAGPGRLRYREDVTLRLAGGHEGPAHREYTYVLEPGAVRVLLADGTVMHVLAFAEGPDGSATAADVHPCRADEYAGTYTLGPDGALTVDMHVTGPAKDYRIRTRYERT